MTWIYYEMMMKYSRNLKKKFRGDVSTNMDILFKSPKNLELNLNLELR